MLSHNAIIEAVQGAVAGGVGWTLISYAVRTMPQPVDGERWYGWLHAFLQLSFANPDQLKRAGGNVQGRDQ